jgi:hypothetical protein
MGAHISKLVVCSALLTYGFTPGVMAKGSTGKGRLARYLTDAGSFPSTRQRLESTRPLTYDGPKKFPRRKFRAIVKKDRSPKEFDELVGRVWKSPSRCTDQFCKKDGPNDMTCTCLDSNTDAPHPRRLKAWARAIREKNKKCKYRTCWKVGPDGMACQCRDSDTSNGPESAANGLSSDSPTDGAGTSGNDMDSTLYDVNGPLNYVGPKKFPRRKLRARVKKDNRSPEFDELVGRISPPTRFSRRLGNMGHLRRRPNIGCTWRCVGGKYCKKVCPSSTPSSHYTHCVQQNEINCEGTGVCNVVTVQICD